MQLETFTGHRPAPAPTMETLDRRRMERDLRQAVRTGRLVLHYQPRLRLGTADIVGYEALLRWPDRKRGMVAPTTFLPVAERGPLIEAIGGWVLETACRDAAQRAWPGISVNLSARQLDSSELPGQIEDALDRSGLPPERLELEITESVLVGCDGDALLALAALRDLGVGLAMDDFGTGHGSLSALRRLPLTTLKIDRSLIRDLPHGREDAALVHAVTNAGRALGLTVVGEGVETEEQRAFLSGIGCTEGQGYLFGRPLPLGELPPLI